MKITDVKTYVVGNPWKNWIFAKVETDEGIHGIGEGTVSGFAKTIEAGINELKRFVIGLDPFQIEVICQRMNRDMYTEGGQLQGCMTAAIETACWDIMGKSLNQPAYNLMGGRCHEKIRAYANGWYQGPHTAENFHEKAKIVVDAGYTALKFDPFGAAWRYMEPGDEALTIDIIAAVRDAVGPQVDILIEGHSRFSVGEAIKLGQLMEPFKPRWFEEPTHHGKIDAVVEVARSVPVPVATGESYSSKHQFAELLAHNAVHILQPDYGHLGGLFSTRKICDMVDAHYGIVAPHNAQGPISSAVCMQFAACTPNFFIQEMFDEFNVPWEARLVTRMTEVKDGYIDIPTEPGIGVDLNFDILDEHPYQEAGYMALFRRGWEQRQGELGLEDR
jgi:galactonate dehydratase